MKLKQRVQNVSRIDRARIIPSITAIVREESAELKEELQAITPVDTGNMQKKWRRRVTNTTRKVTLRMFNAADYAGHVHYRGEPSKKVLEAADALFEARAEEISQRCADRVFKVLIKEP